MPLEMPIEQITEAHLRQLIDNKVCERKSIDYKQAIPSGKDGDRKEFLADVSSFANSGGGHLVYGMREEAGLPVDLCGLNIDDPDAKVAELDSRIRDGIRPRIPGVVVWVVPLSCGKTAIVIRVPKSFASPHMVTFANASRFYSRNSNGRNQLDIDAIRAAFLLSEKTADRLRDFRLDRVAKIMADETPMPLVRGARVVLHVVPLAALSSFAQIDLQSVGVVSRDLELTPLGCGGGCKGRFNLEGYVRYADAQDLGFASAYLQIFRNGALETVDTSLASNSGSEGHLAGANLESDVLQTLRRYVVSLKHLQVDVPFAVMISLLGVRGYNIGSPETARMRGIGRFDRDVILVPEVLLESFDADIERLMMQPFNMVWNAAGWARSLYYDQRGQRRMS